MSAAGTMTMRAEVQRNEDESTDSWGHPGKPNYQPRNQVPCRVWSKQRQEVVDENKTIMVEDIKGLFETGVDLTEGDRIGNIVDRRQAVQFAGPLKVVALIRRRRHTEAILERFAA